MVDVKEVEKNLMELKELTKRFGVLADAQTLQMANWLLIAVDTATEAPQILWGFEQKEIQFIFKKLPKKLPTGLDKKLDVVTDSIWWLIGDEYTVKVKADKKLIYRKSPTKKLTTEVVDDGTGLSQSN